MLVVGTAGHIDHGKSSIVNRLTGTNPDRLPEEKKRGMTIDLGFAFMKANSGDDIGFIDVPGHERFVKNMISGVGGIDSVLLVVAADDGWMPQSEEHFQIVRMLGLQHGAIVINKIDLAKPDWLDVLEDDIKNKLKGSFLEEAPIFRVSSTTGEGFDKLSDYLKNLPEQLQSGKDISKPRLYIDRSFVRQGIGGVVTGTLQFGNLNVGESVSIWPSLATGKIRTLHSNNQDVATAVPGQRTAVSITGVDKEKLVRGGAITTNENLEYYQENPILFLSVELLPSSPVVLKDRRNLLFLLGTQEIEGEIRLLAGERIEKGTRGFIFFKPNVPILGNIGDRFVFRLPTPMITIGGGEILSHHQKLPPRKTHAQYSILCERDTKKLGSLVTTELEFDQVKNRDSFLSASNFADRAIDSKVESLVKEKHILQFDEYLIDKNSFDNFATNLVKLLESNKTLSKPEITGKTLFSVQSIDIFLNMLIDKNQIEFSNDKYSLCGSENKLPDELRPAYDTILATLKRTKFAPPKLSELASGGKQNREAIRHLISSGEVYKCGSEFIFEKSIWEEIVNFIKELLNEKNEIAISDLKNKFGLSRKYLIPILEESDRIGLTVRSGDKRVRGEKFES